MKIHNSPEKLNTSSLLWFNHFKISINPEDVVYLKSQVNYTLFCLNDGQTFLTSFTMKIYENALAGRGTFKRIHRGVLINLSYLTAIERTESGNIAYLSTGEKFEVSRRKMKVLELSSR